MMFEAAGYQLLPVLPEIVLAVGAMVLLMIGAYCGQRAAGSRYRSCDLPSRRDRRD